jgi:hypothetical protein
MLLKSLRTKKILGMHPGQRKPLHTFFRDILFILKDKIINLLLVYTQTPRASLFFVPDPSALVVELFDEADI